MEEEKVKTKPGNKPIQIDWDYFEDLAMAGCSCVSMSGHLGLHYNTLHDKILEKYGLHWSELRETYKQKGKDLIKYTQFQKAIGKNKDADTTMLIWLGKIRADQRDPDKVQQEKKDTNTYVFRDYRTFEGSSNPTISTPTIPTSTPSSS
jgi:hypothetical protein